MIETGGEPAKVFDANDLTDAVFAALETADTEKLESLSHGFLGDSVARREGRHRDRQRSDRSPQLPPRSVSIHSRLSSSVSGRSVDT